MLDNDNPKTGANEKNVSKTQNHLLLRVIAALGSEIEN
jgi:hypothetical protein